MRKAFFKFITKDLFKVISPEDILQIKKGNVVNYQGKELTIDEIYAISQRAKEFKKSKLWKILEAEIRWQVVSEVFNNPPDQERVKNAHIVWWVLKIINAKLEEISKLRKEDT